MIVPQSVKPDYQAILSAEWAVKMGNLQAELGRRHVIMARNIVSACYGTEPAVVLAAFEATRARYSIETTVQRLSRGILDPDVRWAPKPEL